MKKPLILAVFLAFSLLTPESVGAHSGRTDSSGGHNCNVGACAGTYHYHNGGYVAPAPVAPVYTPAPTIKPTKAPTPKPTVKPVSSPSARTITTTPLATLAPAPAVQATSDTNEDDGSTALVVGGLAVVGGAFWLGRRMK